MKCNVKWQWLLASVLLVSGCAMEKRSADIPAPLRDPAGRIEKDEVEVMGVAESAPEGKEETVHKTPSVPPVKRQADFSRQEAKTAAFPDSGTPFRVNFVSLPLPAFINEVFGNLLQVPFEIAAGLQRSQDLVTLRSPEPVSAAGLYQLARQVLENYGVTIEVAGDLYRFVPAKEAAGGEPPLLVSGLTLPTVPTTHRTVFYYKALKAVNNYKIQQMLGDIYSNEKLSVQLDQQRNAIVLKGPAEVVAVASEMIDMLDQPSMRGNHSARYEPLFWPADKMAEKINELLRAEGYDSSVGASFESIAIIPLPVNNSLVFFSGDRSLLTHILEWARAIDTPPRESKDKVGIYLYHVENTMASNLVATLGGLFQLKVSLQAQEAQGKAAGGAFGLRESDDGAAVSAQTGARGREQPAATPARQPTSGLMGSGINDIQRTTETAQPSLTVDERRNTIIFRGTGELWGQLLPVIKQMDQPDKMVLVEVIIAELALENDMEFGVEWKTTLDLFGLSGPIQTLKGLGIGASGINYYPVSDSGKTQAILNAFASDSRLKILSSPRIMVRSGYSASINIGEEIPILSSQSTAQNATDPEGNVVLSQSIQYRQTGVLLNVKPLVHTSNRLDLDISQEISSAIPNKVSSVNSPAVRSRQIKTNVTLNDGGSVLLGGLISTTHDQGNSRVPLLGDIPVLGQAFRMDSAGDSRSELLIFIVPYIINDSSEAEEITRVFRRRLSIERDGDSPEGVPGGEGKEPQGSRAGE